MWHVSNKERTCSTGECDDKVMKLHPQRAGWAVTSQRTDKYTPLQWTWTYILEPFPASSSKSTFTLPNGWLTIAGIILIQLGNELQKAHQHACKQRTWTWDCWSADSGHHDEDMPHTSGGGLLMVARWSTHFVFEENRDRPAGSLAVLLKHKYRENLLRRPPFSIHCSDSEFPSFSPPSH